ncbi:hypothetical protein JQ594_05170 [Bradyrhizobium manausense]|uniref:hypothetical protein n=1 Tax=Bradyrhizobium manausense TaxID=989370 RepID=UPI001BAB2CC7|nr:hypothetical protein [Bradyrhizobium manausense]MBR0685295.1 hypothetical protein [Bradyrhizobium manausense]
MLDITSAQDFNCESASSSTAKSEAQKPPKPPRGVTQKQLELIAGKTREELLLATAPHIDPESPAFKESIKKVEKIAAAEAARAVLDADREEELTLLPPQDEIVAYFNEGEDLILRQKSWPDEDQVICIHKDLISQFIDRLTDLVGIPSFGGPER